MQSLQEKNVYLDQAATSFPKPESVTQSMLHYMTQIGCNVNRGSYSAALDAEDILFDTREQLSDFFHGDDCRNTIFTANVTTSLNVILKGLLKPGDHVLVSSMEHNAVMRPLQQLKKAQYAGKWLSGRGPTTCITSKSIRSQGLIHAAS